jgi:hypothetical protein
MAQKDSQPASSRQNMEAIRKELHQLVDAALERVFKQTGVQPDGHYADFTERESLAASLGKEFGECFLEAGLLKDPRCQEILKAETLPCPTCHIPSPRAVDKDGQPLTDEVQIETRVGTMPLSSPIFRCAKCRRNFSPLTIYLATQRRTLQSFPAQDGELGRW